MSQQKITPTAMQVLETWLDQVVVGKQLCPFAREPRAANTVRLVEYKDSDLEALALLIFDELQRLSDTKPSELETTVVMASGCLGDFDDYLQLLSVVEQLIETNDWEGVFQVASFHPDYCFDGCEPDDAANLSNRSPAPLFHLLREDSISKAVDSMSNPDAIYERNIALLRGLDDKQRKALFPYLFS